MIQFGEGKNVSRRSGIKEIPKTIKGGAEGKVLIGRNHFSQKTRLLGVYNEENSRHSRKGQDR